MAVISFCAGCIFWLQYRTLDKQEDALNMLPTGHMGTADQAKDIERRLSAIPGLSIDRGLGTDSEKLEAKRSGSVH